MKMAEMTFAEVKAYLPSCSDLIIPIGTCEQHGYHLPLNNDILMAEFLADRLSEATGCLVAPTVNYGVNLPCDRLFSGTTSLTPALLHSIIESIIDWWRIQGFSRFFLLTFHGDPFHVEALSGIRKDVILLDPCDIEYGDVLQKQTSMRHACEAETSIALYLYPEKVRSGCIREHDIPYDAFESCLFHQKDTPPDGYVGNLGFPSAATAEKGRILLERMVDKLIAEYIGLDKRP